MADTDRLVDCATHGPAVATFVCRHLACGSGLRYYAATDTDGPYPHMWCAECEQVRIQEGGDWNDASEAFAGITLICNRCYEAVRQRNQPA
jgi:hypothetical protein